MIAPYTHDSECECRSCVQRRLVFAAEMMRSLHMWERRRWFYFAAGVCLFVPACLLHWGSRAFSFVFFHASKWLSYVSYRLTNAFHECVNEWRG